MCPARLRGLLLLVVALFTVAVPATAASAATGVGSMKVALSPTSPAVGDTVDAVLRLSTAGYAVNVVQGDVTYPQDKLQLSSIDSTGSPWPHRYVDQSRAGLVSVVVGVDGGDPPLTGQNLLVFTAHFLVIAPGTATVAPSGNSAAPTSPDGQYNAVYGLPLTRTGQTITIGAMSPHYVGHMSPPRLGTGARRQVTLQGTGFTNGATLAVGSAPDGFVVTGLKVTSSTAISAFVAVPAGTPENRDDAYYDVRVTSGGVTTTCTACLYVPDETRVYSASPTTVARGTSATLVFDGYFESGTHYTVNAGPGTTVSNVRNLGTDINMQLYADVTITPQAAKGKRTVIIKSLDDYGVVRCPACFSVVTP